MVRTANVDYRIATYSGTVAVDYEPDDEDSCIIAKAKAQLRRKTGSLPYGYEEFAVHREED